MSSKVKFVGLDEIKILIDSSQILVSYSPLGDEIRPIDFSIIKDFSGLVVAIPNKNFPDPFDYSIWLKKYCGKRKTVVLIPGQQFDLFGTRYGRGGGWYDRLLSQLPNDWLRIGLAKNKRIVRCRLPHQPHDEPVDWLIGRVANGWRAFETKARTNPAVD